MTLPGLDIPAILTPLYTAPSRHYHNLAHIQSCLILFHEYRHLFTRPAEAELALWFHDAIYDPTRSDNEEQSAALARQHLAPHFPTASLDRIESLILATKHTHTPKTDDQALVIDIDLSILGADPAIFDAYEANIRREYAHIPDDLFRTGRAIILRRFLDRPTFFTTPALRSRFESQARANLTRSLANLIGP